MAGAINTVPTSNMTKAKNSTCQRIATGQEVISRHSMNCLGKMRPRTMRRGPKGRRGAVQQWAQWTNPVGFATAQRWTSTGILQWARTLTVSLPRTIAEMPWRPCEAMTIRSQPFESRYR